MKLKLADFSYHLPQEFIADQPASPRDHARLLVLNRRTGHFFHHHFFDIGRFLNSNDVLVLNQTKVFPARIFGVKPTGGKVELLLLNQIRANSWLALAKPGCQTNLTLSFPQGVTGFIERQLVNGEIEITFNLKKDNFFTYLNHVGYTPIPPYIKTKLTESQLRSAYQTIYASHLGSAAAPTAGMHFTKPLLKQLATLGVQFEKITLHVGLGTFQRLRQKNVSDNQLHYESYSLSAATARRLNFAKAQGKRIIAVGTTTTRALESAFQKNSIQPGERTTNLFIYPPYHFHFVDSLITNFHLPESSLIMMIAAFVSYPQTQFRYRAFTNSIIGQAYHEAIKHGYRFFSFGDACFIE